MTVTRAVRASDDYGRHIPDSHPVLLRMPSHHPEPDVAATVIAGMTDRIDHLAMLVRQLPEQPLTVSQRRSLHIISIELTRRAEAWR